MAERAMMALFDAHDRLPLPNGYWLQKSDDNRWQIGGPRPGGEGDWFLAMHIAGNVPVGPGGSMDHDIKELSEALTRPQPSQPPWRPDREAVARLTALATDKAGSLTLLQVVQLKSDLRKVLALQPPTEDRGDAK